jgi:mannose-P-dolichol utilization defect 1
MSQVKDSLQGIIGAIGSLGWPLTLVENIMNNKECANTLFYKDFLDGPCLSLAISKALGYVTIAGACLYKMPVVVNIFKSKSGTGLHPLSVYLESSSMISMVFYNFQKGNDISTYGDNISATIQNIMIVLMIWYYGMDGKSLGGAHIAGVFAVFIIFGAALTFCPEELFGYVAIYATVIMTVSKIPQIIQNFQTKNIGVQSWVTQLTAFLGVLAKLFICITETGDDVYLMAGNVTAVVLNGTLMVQSLMYPGSSAVDKKKKD